MIIRRRHTANFTTIGNVLFEDDRLKADEVGILAYLLSRPNDWEVRRPALMRRWDMGRDAIKRVVTNFLRTGWARAQRVRLANGTTYVIYEIRDEPGPSLSDDEVRRALSLGSSEAAQGESEENDGGTGLPETGDPPTCYPPLADPSPGNPYVANKELQNTDSPRNDSTQIEREHERARQKHAIDLSEFKRRYPTAASDDQAKIDRAWFALTMPEGEAAIAGIAPFLGKLKRDGRKHAPAAWKYLEEKRWSLLEQTAAAKGESQLFADGSSEAIAITVAYSIVGKMSFVTSVMRSRDSGGIYYLRPVTTQLIALAQAPPEKQWVTLTRQQAFAWNEFLEKVITLHAWSRLVENSRAPYPWPPNKEGKIYEQSTGPPRDSLSDETAATLQKTG